MELTRMTAAELSAALAASEVSATEVTQAHLDRIAAVDDRVHAFLHVAADSALAQAADVDTRRAAGERLAPLAGVPVAVKDVFTTENMPTTCGSRILAGWHPPYDATITQRLKQAGAIILGKTNMDEFAMGSSTENSAFGPSRNPWDLTKVPGGSSGGSAAAVAAYAAPLAIGTDTGGSIRQPAALCGIVGLKPTYGAVSRYGMIAFASSLDQAGPLTRDVTDAALLYSKMVGARDPRDSTSLDFPGAIELPVRADLAGVRIGVPAELCGEGIEPGVLEAFEATLELARTLGASVEPCALPHAPHALAAYYVLAPAEASSNLARFDGVRYGYRSSDADDLIGMYTRTRHDGFGAEVKRRIMLGTYALSSGYYDAYYRQAQKVRTLIAEEFDRAFESVDALVCPTSPIVAFPKGDKSDPLSMYLCDVLTIPVNLAGLPGISIPCGLSQGLPVGLQVIGPRLGDAQVLRVAHAYEAATAWHAQMPPSSPTATGTPS